ncbi:phage tail tape measure protein, TP901 family, core region [Kosakonia arachidis]|uniref:Phage tail tape measure protein, TP901 family, core region n=1 Tax=Kosakonia arachidis TaxID=551989 RepID=A0A1I7E360_9ENTR|nr:phage tail tape measure protein [Kosakonia arachidis]SFU18354.1 phage tail tape measure protein, TP901 family, core region [Kosakonia arachidis]
MSSVKLQVLLKAVDQATRPLKSIDKASKELAGGMRATQTTLRELNSQASKIEGFRRARAQLAVTGQSLEKAKQEAAALAVAFKQTENPTRAQAQAMETARKSAAALQLKHNSLRESVQRQRQELSLAGINTRTLAADERRLKTSIGETTSQLNRQREALARVSAQQEKLSRVKQRYQAGKALAGNAAAVGAAGVGIATTATLAGTALLKPGYDFAQKNSELQAVLGVGKDSAEMAALRKQARQLGDNTAASADDAAGAQIIIAKGGVVAAIAARNKLTASVIPALAGIHIPHIDQTQESDAKFLTRLADRNGGEVSVKAGKLLFLKAGNATTASGRPIPQVMITRSDGDRHQFSIADRGAYTGVTAQWLHTKDPKPKKVKVKRKPKEQHLRALQHPKAKAKKKETKVPEAREGEYLAGEADNVFALTTVFATKAQAMRAAQAKWDKLQRGVAEFSINLAVGRADLYPETPVKVSGFKSVIDEQAWLISRVTHNLNNNGFTTGLELEIKLSEVEYESENDE